MRVSLSAIAACLLLSTVGPLGVFANNAEPKPDTTPDSAPTPTAPRGVKARQTKSSSSSPNLLSALFQLANSFELKACIPAALPLVTTLPKIPQGLLAGGDAMSQALSQKGRDLSDVCDFSITGSVGDVYTSFLPAWYEWYDKHSDKIRAIAEKCTGARSLVKTVEAYRTCEQVRGQMETETETAVEVEMETPTTAGPEDAGATTEMAVDSDVGSESTSAPHEHETGVLEAAAAVAAGVLGVVAML